MSLIQLIKQLGGCAGELQSLQGGEEGGGGSSHELIRIHPVHLKEEPFQGLDEEDNMREDEGGLADVELIIVQRH